MKTETCVLPEINQRRCHGCMECANNCPNNVFTIVPSKRNGFIFHRSKQKIIVANPQNCTGCNKCVVTCRHRAITLLEVV